MSSTEKKQKNQSHQVRWAMANFIEDVAGSSSFTNLLTDYQDQFEVLMRSDDADDPEFRDRAIVMLHFCKAFHKYFKNISWQDAYNEAERMKDNVSLKMLPTNEL